MISINSSEFSGRILLIERIISHCITPAFSAIEFSIGKRTSPSADIIQALNASSSVGIIFEFVFVGMTVLIHTG
jgi:hypothetical protein